MQWATHDRHRGSGSEQLWVATFTDDREPGLRYLDHSTGESRLLFRSSYTCTADHGSTTRGATTPVSSSSPTGAMPQSTAAAKQSGVTVIGISSLPNFMRTLPEFLSPMLRNNFHLSSGRVVKEEADNIVETLGARGMPVEYVVAGDAGHGFSNPENLVTMFRAIERHFGEHLGRRSA